MGVGKVNYCLESGLCLLFGSSGTEGSMKGRRSEVGCCHAVVRGKQGGVAFFQEVCKFLSMGLDVLSVGEG